MTSGGPYKIGTITRLTGFSSALLRAWERRYRLLKPERGPGGHRVYGDQDLRVLRKIRDLLEEGRTIGEIATLGRARLLAAESPREDSMARSASFPALETVRQDLVEAALVLDSNALNRVMDEAAGTFSADVVMDQIIEPVAKKVGDLWEADECSVASEHLISSVFRHRLLKLIEASESRAQAPTVLAACMPGEEHELGILMVSYFINRNGVRVLYLGSSLPFEACRHASSIVKPDAILLSLTRGDALEAHRSELLSLVDKVAVPGGFYLGGQGVPSSDRALENGGVRLVPARDSGRGPLFRIAAEIRSASRSGRGRRRK